jgi:predicted helicase
MLPRIPLVDEPKEFWAFSKAGRALAELYLNYETAPRPEGVKVIGEDRGYYSVEKIDGKSYNMDFVKQSN